MDEHQMKKWIKELAEKAGLEQERWSTTSQFEYFLEKFAELIVLECIGIVDFEIDQPLYTSPPKREPLADDELIQKILDAGFERNSLGWTFTYGRLDYHLLKFARAIEAAHGITGEQHEQV